MAAVQTHGGSAGPLREGKGTTWEGGVRTPAIFWWPGTIAPATITAIGSAMDLLPTAAALAGARLPADRALDGVSQAEVLRTGRGQPRQTLFYYWDGELRAVRKGRYKAHFVTSGAYGFGERRTEHQPPLLYDLQADPGEHVDIAAAHPDVVADLTREAEAHRRTVTPTEPLFLRRSPPRPDARMTPGADARPLLRPQRHQRADPHRAQRRHQAGHTATSSSASGTSTKVTGSVAVTS